MDIFDIYLLNLILTLGMFVVLILRAKIEYSYYKKTWRETERRSNLDLLRRVLLTERELFDRTEGGRELYELLCKMFEVRHPASKKRQIPPQ